MDRPVDKSPANATLRGWYEPGAAIRRDKSKGNRRGRDTTRPLYLTPAEYAMSLHRRAVRWDVLGYELSHALAKAYWSVRPALRVGALRILVDDLPSLSWVLASGFELELRRALREDDALAAAIDAGSVDDGVAASLAARAARQAFDPLLRKFAEDVGNEILPRPDAELTQLVSALELATRDLLSNRCTPGGDLHPPVVSPLADASDVFSDNRLPIDPGRSSGRASTDLIR